jgi:hypothetical protein
MVIKNNVLIREQYYMDLLKPQYNIVEMAGSTLGYKHTPESLAKMRDFVLSDEVRDRKALSTINATAARRISILAPRGGGTCSLYFFYYFDHKSK